MPSPAVRFSKALDFEDVVHDFPQRVTYRPEGPTRPVASVKGALKGELRRIDFAMLRVSCTPPR